MMLNTDKYAYISKLKQIDPMVKLFFSILTLSVCIWEDKMEASIIIFIVMTYITVKKGGIPIKVLLKLLLIPLPFLILGVLSIVINFTKSREEIDFAVKIFGIYVGANKQGILMGLNLFFKSIGAVACLYFISLSTPVINVISALRKLKCPKILVELMGLIYRCIFIFLDMAEIMFTAQKSRLGYSSLKSGYRGLGTLVSTLFIRSYKHAVDMYTSLEARGYDGEIRVLEEPYKKNMWGYFFAVMFNVLIILTI